MYSRCQNIAKHIFLRTSHELILSQALEISSVTPTGLVNVYHSELEQLWLSLSLSVWIGLICKDVSCVAALALTANGHLSQIKIFLLLLTMLMLGKKWLKCVFKVLPLPCFLFVALHPLFTQFNPTFMSSVSH